MKVAFEIRYPFWRTLHVNRSLVRPEKKTVFKLVSLDESNTFFMEVTSPQGFWCYYSNSSNVTPSRSPSCSSINDGHSQVIKSFDGFLHLNVSVHCVKTLSKRLPTWRHEISFVEWRSTLTTRHTGRTSSHSVDSLIQLNTNTALLHTYR